MEETLSITPGGTTLFTAPENGEVNYGAYFTLAEKMYDTAYGFRLVELLSIHDPNQSEDSVVIIVTHDGWKSSSEYGLAYIISPKQLSWQSASIGYIVDSNDVWTAKAYGGPVVLHTSNGGMSWDSVGNTPVEDFFVNPKTHEVFCMSSDSVVDFAYSSDYGSTWRLDSTFGIHLWRMSNPAPGILWGMISQSGPGWTGGEIETMPASDVFGAPNDYSRKLGYSSDNGKTWAIDSTTFIDDSLEEMHWLDARHGWVASWSHDSLFMWYYDADAPSGVVEHTPPHGIPLVVFPNPSQSWVTVSGALQDVALTDVMGRTCPCPRSGNMIDVSKLPAGVYFVNNHTQHTRLLKE